MCTVSIVPVRGGLRMVCNRDERRARPAALAPRTTTIGARTAEFPTDAESGGTWIGANDAELAFVLLNRSTDARALRSRPVRSRGTIIPELLPHNELHGAAKHVLALDPRAFAPFRLVAVQGSTIATLTSDGGDLSLSYPISNVPLMFTSSSLGDDRVEGPRRALFLHMLRHRRSGWTDAQNRFHRHFWPHARAISVLMYRADAHTVSRTVVEMRGRTRVFRYEPLTPVD